MLSFSFLAALQKKFSVTLNGRTKLGVLCDVLINHCNLVSRLVDKLSSVSAVWVWATLLQQPFKSGKLFPAYCLFVEMFPTTSVADKTLLANFCPFCFLPSSLLTLVTSISTKLLRMALLLKHSGRAHASESGDHGYKSRRVLGFLSLLLSISYNFPFQCSVLNQVPQGCVSLSCVVKAIKIDA